MTHKKRFVIWSIFVIAIGVIAGSGYYYLNKAPVISAGTEADMEADEKVSERITADLKREKLNHAKRIKRYNKYFGEIFTAKPEELVIQSILEGNSDLAAKYAKIWELSDPQNTIAKSILVGFSRTGVYRNENYPNEIYTTDFRNWVKNLTIKYPKNPHIKMMSTVIGVDLDGVIKIFEEAIKMQNNNLDFNFGANIYDYWTSDNITVRTRKDWNKKHSVQNALRLAMRLSCNSDGFSTNLKDILEAQRVLETVLKSASIHDLKTIQNALYNVYEAKTCTRNLHNK